MKKIVALMLAMMLCLSLVPVFADGESDLEYIKAKGKLVVGITDFAPMDYRGEDGEWTGIDADLARLFAASLGVEIEFVEIDWDNKILELNAKTVDCIWNGMTLTEEVAAAMSCTDAYLNNAQVIVLPKAKADEINALPDDVFEAKVEEMIAGLTFAVEAGSAGEAAAAELGLNATPVQTQSAALMEAAAGTSDGAIIDLLMAYAMTGEGTGYAGLDYCVELTEEEYVIGFRTGSDLTALANAFLATCVEDGTMGNLISTYLGE